MITVAPQLQALPRKLFRRQRVELERRAQARADLLEVLNLEHRRRRAVHLEYLHGRLQDMLARDPDLLPLEAAEEGNVVVPPGVLATRLLALPLQDESRVAERGRLEEIVASGERE